MKYPRGENKTRGIILKSEFAYNQPYTLHLNIAHAWAGFLHGNLVYIFKYPCLQGLHILITSCDWSAERHSPEVLSETLLMSGCG